MMTTTTGTGAGTPATSPAEPIETIIIVRDFTPGQAARLVFLRPEDVAALPALPAGTLAIIVFPGGQA